MESYILTVGTVTHAIRARRLLASAHISARLVKTTDSRSGGCRYGLELDPRDGMAARRLLDAHGVAYTWDASNGGRRS